MCTRTDGPELGRCPRKVPSVPGIQLVLNKYSFCFPKILYAQLVDEVTCEFPNMGSGREGTERKVQRPVGCTASVTITQLCTESKGTHR